MTKQDALRTLMLLSALESWAFSTKNHLPDYIFDNLQGVQDTLKKIILEEEK